MTADSLPDDLLIDADPEILVRQDLVLTALGKRPADRALRVGHLLDVHTRTWREDQEIIIRGRRIAWVGPARAYQGEVRERFHEPALAAVSGFCEVHKHIESSHLTPDGKRRWCCRAAIPGPARPAKNSPTSTVRTISNSGWMRGGAARR